MRSKEIVTKKDHLSGGPFGTFFHYAGYRLLISSKTGSASVKTLMVQA